MCVCVCVCVCKRKGPFRKSEWHISQRSNSIRLQMILQKAKPPPPTTTTTCIHTYTRVRARAQNESTLMGEKWYLTTEQVNACAWLHMRNKVSKYGNFVFNLSIIKAAQTILEIFQKAWWFPNLPCARKNIIIKSEIRKQYHYFQF